MFPLLKSLITSAVAEMYEEWPFFCPWSPSAVEVGNPGSLSDTETLVKIYKCTQKHWCEWLHWVPGSCCSAAGNLRCGRESTCVPAELETGTVPAPSPAACAEPSSLCLTALTRYLEAYGASPGLHSCAQEPTVPFQNSAIHVHGRCSSCSPPCRQSSFLSGGTQSSQGLASLQPCINGLLSCFFGCKGTTGSGACVHGNVIMYVV